jgi:putative transposase
LIIQTAVEAEVDVFLGRAHYQRAAECPDVRAGSRNVARPKLRGTTERFASNAVRQGVTKSNALESLVISDGAAGLINAAGKFALTTGAVV